MVSAVAGVACVPTLALLGTAAVLFPGPLLVVLVARGQSQVTSAHTQHRADVTQMIVLGEHLVGHPAKLPHEPVLERFAVRPMSPETQSPDTSSHKNSQGGMFSVEFRVTPRRSLSSSPPSSAATTSSSATDPARKTHVLL